MKKGEEDAKQKRYRWFSLGRANDVSDNNFLAVFLEGKVLLGCDSDCGYPDPNSSWNRLCILSCISEIFFDLLKG